jgi:hypothetical protein
MSSYKQQFNRKYKQSLNTSNSKANISRLTGIPVSTLDKVWDRHYKYPATNGYNDLNKKIPKGAFAMSAVYKYALENRKK